MKIISLQAENLKRLVAVEITPSGALVEITGKNRAGKTSVLDAIWWALEGTSHIQAMPIRRGANEAYVRLDLGKLKVTRKFKATNGGAGYTTSIMIENEEGARYNSPQSMLDKLIGELSFDPLAFTRMNPKEQLDALKRFVPDVDFDAIERANKKDFDTRTDVNRKVRELRAMASAISIPTGANTDPIDDAALVQELEQAGQTNATIERQHAQKRERRQKITALCQLRSDNLKRAAELRRQAEQLEAEAGEQEQRIIAEEKAFAELPEVPQPVDTSAIRQRIEAAKVQNRTAAAFQRRQRINEEADTLTNESKALTQRIEDRNAAKAAAIAAAKMPIPGIGFADDGLLLNGVPFDQGSDAEQLRASIAIAAAMNPKIRVIRVRDGSLFDQEAIEILAKFAEENDLQIWMETVESDRPSAVLIEAGHVAGAGK